MVYHYYPQFMYELQLYHYRKNHSLGEDSLPPKGKQIQHTDYT